MTTHPIQPCLLHHNLTQLWQRQSVACSLTTLCLCVPNHSSNLCRFRLTGEHLLWHPTRGLPQRLARPGLLGPAADVQPHLRHPAPLCRHLHAPPHQQGVQPPQFEGTSDCGSANGFYQFHPQLWIRGSCQHVTAVNAAVAVHVPNCMTSKQLSMLEMVNRTQSAMRRMRRPRSCAGSAGAPRGRSPCAAGMAAPRRKRSRWTAYPALHAPRLTTPQTGDLVVSNCIWWSHPAD